MSLEPRRLTSLSRWGQSFRGPGLRDRATQFKADGARGSAELQDAPADLHVGGRGATWQDALRRGLQRGDDRRRDAAGAGRAKWSSMEPVSWNPS